jgi:hypothetical protein
MIDAGPSLQAAERISAPALIRYLAATGWASRPSHVTGISIYSKDISGVDQPIDFILPTESGFSDEQRRVADALRTIAAVEGRSLADIVDDARSATPLVQRASRGAATAGFAEDSETIAAPVPEAETPSKN